MKTNVSEPILQEEVKFTIKELDMTAKAVTVYSDPSKHSWATFYYTTNGALFVVSDWGEYMMRWSHIGERTFESFLIGLNTGYLFDKFEGTMNNVGQGKTRRSMRDVDKENLGVLFKEFQKYLKSKQTEGEKQNEISNG